MPVWARFCSLYTTTRCQNDDVKHNSFRQFSSSNLFSHVKMIESRIEKKNNRLCLSFALTLRGTLAAIQKHRLLGISWHNETAFASSIEPKKWRKEVTEQCCSMENLHERIFDGFKM